MTRPIPNRPNLWQNHASGSWADLNWSHTAAHLYRAVLEGVALEYRLYRDVLRELNPDLKMRELRITGGGEKSAVWNQIKADALGMTVVQINRPEGAPLGAALLAGCGVGLFRSLGSAAGEWIQTGHVVRPDRKQAAHYEARLVRYRRLLEMLQEWSEPET